MLCFLFKFTLVLNSALLFWKLLASEFLLGISETLHCSVSAPHVKFVPLLDVRQLLMLFAGTSTYSEPVTLFLIVFLICYNCYYYYYYYYYLDVEIAHK
jgi:hypothetical protein